jgi:hypothetical protein
MKRTLLDITNVISRNVPRVILTPYNLTDSTYSVWIAKGWRFAPILREVEYRTNQDRLRIRINTHNINPRDYITETISEGLLVKFIKSQFEYPLDNLDEIVVGGDLEKYA